MNLIDPNAASPQDDDAARIERIERTQPLQAGQYWRSRCAIDEEGIDADEVLLIKSVRWVDEAAHTVILRPHPNKIGRDVDRVVKNPTTGKTRSHWIHYSEHRFLIKDFLDQFEPAPDHAQVRANEIAQVQGHVARLQQELVQTQSDPQRLAHVVNQGLIEKAKAEKASAKGKMPGQPKPKSAVTPASRNLVAPADQNALSSMADASLDAVIGQGLNEENVGALRSAAERQYQIATIKADWIKAKTEEISGAIQAMTPYYEEQAAAALAMTEDTRAFVDRLLKGIQSLDLYIGKGVTVETICQGASAAEDVPLTFVQRRLVMEEELAVWADVDSQFDFSNDGMFVKALQQHPELIEQIFPTPRCVLVMRTLRHERDYGDAWTNAAKNSINMTVFLLVRDGQNVHRVYSAVESHLRADRLFPSHNEQKKTFKGIDGEDIKFKDVYYTDQLKDHERHALHYKRFLILAAGLDHRLQLFGRFYPGPKSLHFVSLDFQERYCRFLHDDEKDTMLSNSAARPPLAQWLQAMNSFITSGSRLLCVWSRLMTTGSAPAAFDRRGEKAYNPQETCSICVASMDQGKLCVFVQVSGRTADWRERTFNCRVELATTDPFAAFCLDAVEPEDLHHYIHHRDTRQHHLNYIRAFKVALRHVQAERLQEADTRSRLLAALNEGGVGEPQARMDLVGQTVRAWRAAKRGAPLPSFDADGNAPREWPSLLDQMAVLAGTTQYDPTRIARWLTQQGLVPLRLSSTGGQRLVVYAAGSASEQDDRLEPFAWVHRIRLDAGGRVDGESRERSRRWVSMPLAIAAETTLHEWDPDAVRNWAERKSVFASPEEKRAIFDRINAFGDAMSQFNAVRLKALFEQSPEQAAAEHRIRLDKWLRARNAIGHKRYVRNPHLCIPIGLWRSQSSRSEPHLRVICALAYKPERLLLRLAPTQDDKKDVVDRFTEAYADKEHARSQITETSDRLRMDNWQLNMVTLEFMRSDVPCVFEDGYFHVDLGIYHDGIQDGEFSPLIDDRLLNLKQSLDARTSARRESIAWANGLFVNGKPVLQDLLGIERPADFEELSVINYSIHQKNETLFTVVDIVKPTKKPPQKPSSFDDLSDGRMSLEDMKQLLLAKGLLTAESCAQIGMSSSARTVYSRKEAEALALSYLPNHPLDETPAVGEPFEESDATSDATEPTPWIAMPTTRQTS